MGVQLTQEEIDEFLTEGHTVILAEATTDLGQSLHKFLIEARTNAERVDPNMFFCRVRQVECLSAVPHLTICEQKDTTLCCT